MMLFNTYVKSIFMYNSELWLLTKKMENEVDVFQRNLLRKFLNIRYTIRNVDLYSRTKEEIWSQVIRTRRLNWTGHLLRSQDESPVWPAYSKSKRYVAKEKTGNKLTRRKMINNDFRNRPDIVVGCGNIRDLAGDQEF